MLHNRISAAREHLTRAGVDFLVVFNLVNVRFLAGFTGSDGALVLGADESWFLTDSRYTTQANQEVTGSRVVEYRRKLEDIAALLLEQGAARVGFEAAHTTVASRDALGGVLPGVELVPVGEEFDDIRQLKEPEELALLDHCAGIASAAFIGILDRIRPGAVERDLALELEFAMKRSGAEEKSFDFIVASGERGAMPHGKAGDRKLRHGDLVTFDFGAMYRGYASDETVTVAVGAADEKQREIYGIVKDAHDRALDGIRPGVLLSGLDALARRHIEAAGYGQYFGHGLGHGVGLEVHEKPAVSFRSTGVVTEGMVFTIEPGIYIPGWGGVRIEDTVQVTSEGFRLLTKVPKELMIV
jgi:Xaa-Pro aminopeptidase